MPRRARPRSKSHSFTSGLVRNLAYSHAHLPTCEYVNMKTNRLAAGLSKLKEAAGKVEDKPAAPAQDAPPSRVGKVAVAAYFDPAVRKQLAMMHIEQDKTQAALVAEALNLLFEKYGKAPIARA